MSKQKSLALTERELIKSISDITGHRQQVVNDVLRAMHELALCNFEQSTPIHIGKLGVLSVIEYSARGGYNFRTKENMPNKVIRLVRFKPSASVLRILKKKKS